MDPIAIILTVFACLAGLGLLASGVWAFLASYLFRKARKSLAL